MIKDGKPYTDENGWIDDKLITDLSFADQENVAQWIDDNIVPCGTPNIHLSSYSLKHMLEQDTGIYLTNNQFKDALLMEGYEPVNPDDLNWIYKISVKTTIYI